MWAGAHAGDSSKRRSLAILCTRARETLCVSSGQRNGWAKAIDTHACSTLGFASGVASGDRVKARLAILPIVVSGVGVCNIIGEQPDLDGLDVRVTFLHTTDIHSRLLPYRMKVAYTDQQLGLKDENGPFGGAARMAWIIRRERARAERSLYLDTGDPFQGAPIFNVFKGEVEMRVLSEMGLDVMAIGNHEFDLGDRNVARWIREFANFPVLAANYLIAPSAGVLDPPLAGVVGDVAVFNLEGLRVGVIGLGNTSSMTGLFEAGNKMGITPLDPAEVVQFHVDRLKPHVDVIVVASHLGLTGDEALIQNTTGIDIVFGGHHHIVLNPPKVVRDCQVDRMDPLWRERFLAAHSCTPREVPLVHSGAFAKYVGRLDVVFRQASPHSNDWEVASYKYVPIPVDATVPEDAWIAEVIEPYRDRLRQTMMLDLILGYAPRTLSRFGSRRGDSQLGNLVAESMRRRQGIETDFAVTNTLGIRTDIYPGVVTLDELYNVFPFDNTITTMYLSGSEVVQLFDFIASRSAIRGCNAQAQIAGARAVLMCNRCDLSLRPAEWQEREETRVAEDALGCALSIEILGQPVRLDAQYHAAVNTYIANGGSGFHILKRNTTRLDTGIPQRDALMDFMRQGRPCGGDRVCQSDSECGKGFMCGCEARSTWHEQFGTCVAEASCAGGSGRCVPAQCVADAWEVFVRDCPPPSAGQGESRCSCEQRARAMRECASVACLDEGIGAVEDGRLEMRLP